MKTSALVTTRNAKGRHEIKALLKDGCQPDAFLPVF